MAGSTLIFLTRELLITPEKAWETIVSENRSSASVRNGFLLPFLSVMSLSALAGSLIFTTTRLSPFYSVLDGIRCFVVFLITVYASAYTLTLVTKNLNMGNSFPVCFKLIVYSLAPLFLCQILSRFFESLQFVNILAIFGLNIFWTGAEKVLPSSTKKSILLAAAAVIFILFIAVTDYTIAKIFDRVYYAFHY